MKLFIDSGNIKDIETLTAIGIIDGVTTNPTLLAKEPGDYRENLKKICQIVKGPVSGEVTATDFAGMLSQGHDIAGIDQHMIVKVPLPRDGIEPATCRARAHVNLTLCSPRPGSARAQAGATYIVRSRLLDSRHQRHGLDREIVEIYNNYDFVTEILVASCRHPIHVIEAARLGADIATCPPAVIDQMFNHPLTTIGLEKFLKDWEKAQAVKA